MTRTFLFALILCLACCLKAQNFFQTDQEAELMVSGLGFNECGGPLLFNHPNGLASDGERLLVCDRFNNRVLVWEQAPDAWDALPDLVIGQPDFTSNNPGAGKHQLNWPGNASLASNGVLVITDTNNDRILIWNQFPVQSGQPANLQIHLPSITPQGAMQLWAWPWGVWTDGSRLAAVATQGHAILFWNSLPETDNQKPDYVIDLPQMGTPRNISTDGSTYFFVGDHNAKVNGSPGTFFWNSFPQAANQPYDFYRNEWIKGAKLSGGALVAGGLSRIYVWDQVPTMAAQEPDHSLAPSYYKNGDGVDVVEAKGRIYVNNYNGNNILVYDGVPGPGNPDPSFSLGNPDLFSNTLDSLGYIQNPVMSGDGQRLIISSDFDRRIFIYQQFPTASGTFPDSVISVQPWGLVPWDNALHQNRFVTAGLKQVAVWEDAGSLSKKPDRIFNGKIGSVTFNDLKGVALDDEFLYVADRDGKVYLWKGVPKTGSEEPALTLNLGNVQLSRLSSDGKWLCVTQQSPAAVYLHQVSELVKGQTTPGKVINNGQLINLPAEALTFGDALAIAAQGSQQVLIWKDLSEAGDPAKAVVLGQKSLGDHVPAIGKNRLFMPGALLNQGEDLWVGEFKFSSRVLKFSPAGVTGTDEVLPETRFELFPNPAGSEAYLRFAANWPSEAILFDVAGREVARFQLDGPLNKFDIKSFAPGLYLVRAGSQVRKLVVRGPG